MVDRILARACAYIQAHEHMCIFFNISFVSAADICRVSADTGLVSTADTCPVSTEATTAASRRPAAVLSSVETG